MDIQFNHFPYPIYIAEQSFPSLIDRLSRQIGKKFLLTDQHVAQLYSEQLEKLQSIEQVYVHTLPAGEESKSLSAYQEVLTKMAVLDFTRSDCFIAWGGGVIGDLGGFIASTYLRGIPFIQVPTTLLAMVDSAIGGKTGLNFATYKNQIGSFYQPQWVHIDPAYLKTLDHRQINNGLAEVIKYGILCDPNLFEQIKVSKDQLDYFSIIRRSLEIKHHYVSQDPYDQGQRQFLNLGHTFGHAIEAVSHHQIHHGEAVAIGLSWIAQASYQLGWTHTDLKPLLESVYQQHGLSHDFVGDSFDLLNAMTHDKKSLGQKIHLIIPIEIGHCIREAIPTSELMSWIQAGRGK
ncbi:3-dehydroquinate synthase [Facklamia sp. DSM 111018]|uniref:3-dehydroquinate synthase n=1 Tax=Facklamia lactis TaxID=2749967 RepID=A0ABS0LNN7_9LACT|nr:3-dehydroquinate synthase [Facklamia lactis]MBG9979563.1 3-dehydroquinate synthase [Facklamia lactis]MBG9985768.1 3-dehydroquinate synthase [Facklamia lactis]